MIAVPFTSTKPKSVFHLHDPAALYRKLVWEIAELAKVDERRRGKAFDFAPAYQAYNCAVTAWRIADGVWAASNPEGRSDFATAFGFKLCGDDRKNLNRFLDALCAKSRALKICREIAKGSKHLEISKPDLTISTDAQFVQAIEGSQHVQRGQYVLNMKVTDALGTLTAQRLFLDAHSFWEDFLGDWGFIEGRPIGFTDR